MLDQTILIAEIDSPTLEVLPDVLSAQIPHTVIDTCTTVNQLVRKLDGFSYGTVAINAMLLHTYRYIRGDEGLENIVPLIVTVSQRDVALAHTAFTGNAFDLIVKPIVPHDAVQTVRLALWQNKLLSLIASRERASARFQEHMAAFPHALNAKEEFASKLAAYDRTFTALTASIRLLLNIGDNQSLFDLAASVENMIRKRALDRILDLCKDGPSH